MIPDARTTSNTILASSRPTSPLVKIWTFNSVLVNSKVASTLMKFSSATFKLTNNPSLKSPTKSVLFSLK